MNTIPFERLWELAIENADPTDEEMYLTVMDETIRKQWEALMTIRDHMDDAEAEEKFEPIGSSEFRDAFIQEVLKAHALKENLGEFTQPLKKRTGKDSAPVEPIHKGKTQVFENIGAALVQSVETFAQKLQDWQDYIFTPVEGEIADAAMAARALQQQYSMVGAVKWISPHGEKAEGQYSKGQDGCVFRIRWPNNSFNGKKVRFFGESIQIKDERSEIKGVDLRGWFINWTGEDASLQVFNSDTNDFEPWAELPFK